MKETIEEMMKRIAVENDFEGKEYSNFAGVSPEITLTYLYGDWVAEFFCQGEPCFFIGDNSVEIYQEIEKELDWDGDDFEGNTAYKALKKMDVISKSFRERDFILTADIERD